MSEYRDDTGSSLRDEDAVFFDILAEELARRDLEDGETLPETDPELMARIEEYYSEFEQNGIDHLIIEE